MYLTFYIWNDTWSKDDVCLSSRYLEEKNKEDKLDELSKQGIKGYCYQKENQYYVLSMISENRQEIDTHASQVKGILKTYKVSKDTTIDILLQNLAKGVTHD